MSFLVGKNVEQRGVDKGTASLQDELVNYIKGQGLAGLNPGTTVDSASAAPYQKLFADQNAQTFGAAKESAGNLTGSGLGNSLGTAAQRASTEQGSFLANLFENRRQADANRWLQTLMGSLNSNAAQVTHVHQKGLLEVAGDAAAKAAPFLIPGAGPALGAAGLVAGAAGGTGAPAPGGQLGQASRYNFDGGHEDKLNPGDSSYWAGFVPSRDSFGTSRGW